LKKIILHAGLHKTGSTSIQKTLFSNISNLEKNNFSYPLIGNPNSYGQHNLAWEISEDRRFNKNFGTFSDFFNHLDDFKQNIIISSEDFESILLNKKKLNTLKEKFQYHNCEFSILIYIRNPIDYIVSIYLELLKKTMRNEFDKIFNLVLKYGQFEELEYKFLFNYDSIEILLNQLNINYKIRVVDSSNFDSLTDFLKYLDFKDKVTRIDDSNSRYNHNEYLKLFYRNNNLDRNKIELKKAYLFIDLFYRDLKDNFDLDFCMRLQLRNSMKVVIDKYNFRCLNNKSYISISNFFSNQNIEFINKFKSGISFNDDRYLINFTNSDIIEIKKFISKFKVDGSQNLYQ